MLQKTDIDKIKCTLLIYSNIHFNNIHKCISLNKRTYPIDSICKRNVYNFADVVPIFCATRCLVVPMLFLE